MKSTRNSAKIWGWIAVVSALVAVGLHGYLTSEYYQMKLGLGPSHGLCNISSSFNCEAVAASSYAAFLSIPMALWGLWTNAVFAALVLISLLGFSSNPSRWATLGLVFGGLLVGASAVMGAISATQLGTYCLFCIGAYVTSVLAFLGSLLWARSFPGTIGDHLRSLLSTSGTALVVSLALVPALAWIVNRDMTKRYGIAQLNIVVAESLNDWRAARTDTFDPQRGLVLEAASGEAKVTVVEFVDLFCPHCKTSSPVIKGFVSKRPDARMVMKLFPLDGNCNPDTRMGSGDGRRCRWSYALMCAETLAQKGWAALDWIFERQMDLARGEIDPNLEKLSNELQVPLDQMKSCMDDTKTKDLVRAMADEGLKAEIRGTPSIFLNGKKVDRGQFVPVLDAIYREAR